MNSTKGRSGFSLIELLIAIALTAIVIMMSSDAFTVILGQAGQQTKVASSGMESTIGLRTLRYDIEHAGYGLLGQFQNVIAYSEAASAPASNYNDSPTGVPHAIMTGNNVGFNGSDYLVIKSVVAGISDAAQRWTYITQGGNPKVWDSAKLRLQTGNRVVVIKPRADLASKDELVMNGSVFFTQYSDASFSSGFSPKQPSERFIIYGVDPSTDLRMPFNRADYYITRPANIPPSCAPNTGTLFKATVSHADGSLNEMPIMDCVADMQVVFFVDMDGDRIADTRINDISALSAQQVREDVKEVRVYILAQEGQKDRSYVFSPSTIMVGEFGLGHAFDLAGTIGTGWQNFRWKTYTLVVTPRQTR